MANVIGVLLEADTLVRQYRRDFYDTCKYVDESGASVPFPPGKLYIEFTCMDPVVKWEYTISGSDASLKVESAEADKIPARANWQLVGLDAGEVEGGRGLAMGKVQVQGDC